MTDTTSMTSGRSFNKLIAAVAAAEESLADNPWGDTEAERAAHKAAHANLEVARQNLTTAIRRQPWGSNGSVFITDRGNGPGCSEERERTLFINRRRRAVVHYNYHRDDATSGWVEVISAEQAEKKYMKGRSWARESDAIYKAQLDEVANALIKAGITNIDEETAELVIDGWGFVSGQMGGCYWKEGCVSVSAPGALRRAQKIVEARMTQPCRFDSPFAGLKLS